MNKIAISLILFITLPIIGFIFHEYPIEKRLAILAVEEYMEKQGIPKDMIESKKYLKDYKQGGYEINIELLDDPGLTYQYSWLKSRGVVLIVFRGSSGVDTGFSMSLLD